MVELNKQYPEFSIFTFGRAYVYRYFYRQLLYDVLWSGFSATVVYIFVTWHTKSFFISSASMSMILFSFPITLVLYRKVL